MTNGLTNEDTAIILRFMRPGAKKTYYMGEPWHTAAERAEWMDYSVMRSIEQLKARHKREILDLHLTGRIGGIL